MPARRAPTVRGSAKAKAAAKNATVAAKAKAAAKDEIQRLERIAAKLRAYDLISIYAGSSGHPGGTLSIMDIVAALYFKVLNHQPAEPNWPDRDRVFFSAGHKAPALYVGLGMSGYFPLEEVTTLRQLGSPCQGHPHYGDLPGIEISSGSLGQGLGVSVGSALAGKLDGRPYRVYCIMGDGEQQEGSVWEAAMAAGHFKLDNLCAIVDRNRLQIDGWTKDVMNIEPLPDKYRAFGWHVIEIDGHSMRQILRAFEQASRKKGTPTVIIANTVKGKGVSYMEDQAQWHGVAPNKEQFEKALPDILPPAQMTEKDVERLLARAAEHGRWCAEMAKKETPAFSRDYWWNAEDRMKADMDATRMGFGRGIAKAGQDERVVTLHADISASIRITDFEQGHPERMKRVFSVGIAEQNMMVVAAGLAKEGKIPVTGTYGVFAAGRAWDQIRTTICYSNLNVKIAGAHGGISVGADGATHQALEEISLMAILPNMNLIVPADSVETEKATLVGLLQVVGPTYIRYAREATPTISKPDTAFEFGKANVIRYRGAREKFAHAFDTYLAKDYRSEGEDLSIIACGPMVPEAMRAAYMLREEYGLETRVLNVHTVKPLDVDAVASAARDTGVVLTAEEHQVGGFGNIIASAILQNYSGPLAFDMIGVTDRFGESGAPWQLMQYFGLTAEHIAKRAKELYDARVEYAFSSLDLLLTCRSCSATVKARDYLAACGPATDELCVECVWSDKPQCLECRTGWLLVNREFQYICAACK
jgi:transketolase